MNHFLHVVSEYINKSALDIHESSCLSKDLHKILPTSAFHDQILIDVEVGSSGFSSSFAGVSGVLRRRENDRTSVHALQNQACSDLQSLMNSAIEVLSVLEKYSLTIDKGRRKDLPN